ncbi:hypothetical protein Pyrfu_0046 [Pyrolobus fumarii 1A]|uniref:MobA-like NTP transferase domain-containing protein n=1 Tax=Pyrolobus fumarii (strain DSM 11204 / 1A) TaxID=694429 RepID=G0EE02_PYRF1|nr:NTP transferase domain-containing protein [Pyrolobus fumarii]AEM37918.1 hypothetical protein Pyrfu_0046 [Pyrolobus fumarii 1A]
MKLLIVAAGMGTRLRRGPKHLARLWGRPLVHYPLSSVSAALGRVEPTLVVQNAYVEETRAILRENGWDVNLVASFCPYCENGYSLLVGLSSVRSETLLSVADHIYHPCLVERLVAGCPEDAGVCVAGDRKPTLVDIDEATKIRVGPPTVFSKKLEDYDYVDTGVFLVRDWRGMLAYFGHRTDLTMNELWTLYSQRGGRISVVDVTGCLWADVDTESDILGFESGERRSLLEELLGTLVNAGRSK